jgi:hypothetical protein
VISSRTPLALPATACSAPLAQPERIGLTARRVILHRIAAEPLDRSSPGTGVLVGIDQGNRYTLSGVAHRQVTRQGYPCAALLCASVAATTTLLERQIDGSRRPISSHDGWRNKTRREGTTRRGRFISESRSPDYTPLPHNEMLARTYSASNFGSTTPLANQITALSSPKATSLIARRRSKSRRR